MVAAAGTTVSSQGTWAFDADGNGTNETAVVTDDPTAAAPPTRRCSWWPWTAALRFTG